MSPIEGSQPLAKRTFDPSVPVGLLRDQATHPSDVFTVLLLLGGDVVNRALGQLAGPLVVPVTFSFGWVAYAITALVSVIGDNKLMPQPDCDALVINGETGNIRPNTSWIIGRIVRDFGHWQPPETKAKLQSIINEVHQEALRKDPKAERPTRAGLCITVFEASKKTRAGSQPFSWLAGFGLITTVVQLGVAAIPCGIYGDWGILMITVVGVFFSYMFGLTLHCQWKAEKWACRRNSDKSIVLTRGNGAQHAILILGKGLDLDPSNKGRGLDLEDLATVASNDTVTASLITRLTVGLFAVFWVLLLITAAATHVDTWFLVAVGGIGIIQNAVVAAWPRRPRHFGVPLRFREVIADKKAMQALFRLEERYPHTGRNLLETFFQGTKRAGEAEQWDVLALEAIWYDALRAAEQAEKAAGILEARATAGVSAIATRSVLLAGGRLTAFLAKAAKACADADAAESYADAEADAAKAEVNAIRLANVAVTASQVAQEARERFKMQFSHLGMGSRTLQWAWRDSEGQVGLVKPRSFYT